MTDAYDQNDIIDFLGDPSTHGGLPVERIDTHSAVVFLVGDRAYKLKRAVAFPFLDFSTCERRGDFCRREIELNRRTAPQIYLEALPITRDGASGFLIDGDGEPVDWVVLMNRFDQAALLDQLTTKGALPNDILNEIADKIAAFHDTCALTPDHGGRDAMQWILEDNIEEMRAYPYILDPARVARLAERSKEVLETIAERLDNRRRDGFVRHCHGDLHLQNIFLDGEQATLFDCVEFNDRIACIDVMYDLAFLLMDLAHREQPEAANFVLNRYLARTGDFAGAALLPLFLSCRAGIRAKVGAIASNEHPERSREAAEYLDQAISYLDAVPPRLIAVGGTPGTGKSTLAHAIAPSIGNACGAVLVRTDVIRKQMLGVSILERLPESAYDRQTTQRTYDRVVEISENLLSDGISVIADATFTNEAFRNALKASAAALGLPFHGIWLKAPFELRSARIADRTNDPSDATVDVIRQFPSEPDPPTGWFRLDATRATDELAQEALTQILT